MKSQINKICETIKETKAITILLSEKAWGIIEEKVLGNS